MAIKIKLSMPFKMMFCWKIGYIMRINQFIQTAEI